MKKPLFLFPLVFLLIFLGVSQEASAKARTVKIVISGGVLTHAIEITEPRILDISNVWGGEFLDRSRGIAQEAQRGFQRYEVSFYVEIADNKITKKYVLYFYPNSTKEQGYIYLPGKRETWYSLNVGSIIRNGQDGKWNYASPAWEGSIKPMIAAAEAAQHQGS